LAVGSVRAHGLDPVLAEFGELEDCGLQAARSLQRGIDASLQDIPRYLAVLAAQIDQVRMHEQQRGSDLRRLLPVLDAIGKLRIDRAPVRLEQSLAVAGQFRV